MKFFAAMLISFFVMLTSAKAIHAQTKQWYYPVADATSRVSVNPFGILHNAQYYIGKETLFPYNRWQGYHSGTDFETTAAEKNTSVHIYAIYDGTISYIGPVSGYGGLILEKLDDGQHTALYGHLRLTSATVKVGQHVSGGQYLVDLGDQFSQETGMERKHLHLGIYNGQDQYFHGYEQNQQTLNSRWVDPMQFLQQHNAVEPAQQNSTTPSTSVQPAPTVSVQATAVPNSMSSFSIPHTQNILARFFSWLKQIF